MFASELLNISDLKDRIKKALAEDLGSGDITSLAIFPRSHVSIARLKAKDSGVIAGLNIAERVCACVDNNLRFKKLIREGERVKPGQVIAVITGKTRSILAAERTLLNLLQHLSGIASLTAKFVEEAKGTQAKILDTRKTTPLWRDAEKYAVRVGGGTNHRMGLYDAILIKDNHIAASKSLASAVLCAKQKNPKIFIEVEAKSLDEVKESYRAKVDRIMLDNMTLKQMTASVAWLKKQAKPIPETEASGGVSLATIHKIAKTGVDYISIGALTHSPGILDISLLI